jgi:hypothetical protein
MNDKFLDLEAAMRLTGKALCGLLVLCATGLASADGLQWVAKGASASLLPAGVTGTTPLNVCRATLGTVVAVGEFSSDRSGECRVAVGGQEQVALEFEVLASAAKAEVSTAWVPGHATSYPPGSVLGGHGADGQRTLVCAALNPADGSMRPGYIADENCVYAFNGSAQVAENYLVLVTNDPDIGTTSEAQPALEGFDPHAILATGAVASLCGLAEGLCAPH